MSWLAESMGLGDDAPYGVHTLPYGVFSADGSPSRVGVRVGDRVIDLAAVSQALAHPHADVFARSSLNALLSLGPREWSHIRSWVTALVRDDTHRDLVEQHLLDVASVTMQLPVEVADYVDFYASEVHATNVGKIFRPDSPDLPPNWKHLPIGYHGRAGTVVVSGSDVVRPTGQRRPGADGVPPFGPSTTLDIECEVGFVVAGATGLGTSVSVHEARQHLFGVVLLNDWSARDIQAWEYVPLGPFLGKSFATSISAWVVPLEALAAAEVPLPGQDPAPLPYLQGESERDTFGLDLHLEVRINGSLVSSPEFRDMYWSPAQMLAHLTVNGASIRDGDLFASGTVSGTERTTFGSLLERTWNGTEPVTLDDGSERGFLQDGDVVTMTGWAPGTNGARVTLGEVVGRILPAPAAAPRSDPTRP
ncbi:MAG: fumarylacetoacetase [Nocardioidaceae bacterium]